MRPVVVAVLAVLLFLGGFAAVDAQSDDLRAELERLHAVASQLVLQPEADPRERPSRSAPLQSVSVAGLDRPPPWPDHPRIGEEWGMVAEAYLGPSASEKEIDELHAWPGEFEQFLRDRQEAEGQRREYSEKMAELDGPIADLKSENAADQTRGFNDLPTAVVAAVAFYRVGDVRFA